MGTQEDQGLATIWGAAVGYDSDMQATRSKGASLAELRMRAPAAVAVIGAAVAAAAVLLRYRFSVESPGARAVVETASAVCALVSAWWIWVRFTRRRRLSNLLTVAALVALSAQSLVFFALPEMARAGTSSSRVLAPDAGWPLIAGLLAAAALTPRDLIVPRRARWWVVGSLLAASALTTVLLDLDAAAILSAPGVRTALVAAAVASALIAGAGFAGSAIRSRQMMIGSLLLGASILVAARCSYDLLEPRAGADIMSGRDFLRLSACALILMVALRTRSAVRRAETAEAAAQERRRLARDLHDGMAQDLAFIAAHGERLSRELGPEHPVVVASRRALAACRGAIVDLSASSATNAAEALRAVAGELSRRHDVRILVDADDNVDLPFEEREELVRIAREAIVNAIQHGGARTITAQLRMRGERLLLNINDDGCGIGPRPVAAGGRGHGVRTMRERAATLGGRLTIERRAEGGTTVEVVV